MPKAASNPRSHETSQIKPQQSKLQVVVLGDSQYVKYETSESAHESQAEVASGALFLVHALKFLLGESVVVQERLVLHEHPPVMWSLVKKTAQDPLRPNVKYALRLPDGMLTAVPEPPKPAGASTTPPTTNDRTGSPPEPPKPTGASTTPPTTNDRTGSPVDVLFIHDGAGCWRKDSGKVCDWLENAIAKLPSYNGLPSVFVICHELPTPASRRSPDDAPFECPVWNLLHKHYDKVCLILSANDLRRHHALLSRRISFEQTLETFFSELALFPSLKTLKQFGHLILRLGHTGALHCEHSTFSASQAPPRFVFAPMATHGTFRDPVDEGRIVGKSVLMAAALSRYVLECKRQLLSATGASLQPPQSSRSLIESAMRLALHSSMAMFSQGFPLAPKGTTPSTPRDFLNRYLQPAHDLFSTSGGDHAMGERERHHDLRLASVDVPARVVVAPTPTSASSRSDWEILRESINVSPTPSPDRQGPSRINIAMAIVRFGYPTVLNTNLPHAKHDESKYLTQLRTILETPDCIVADEECPDHITLPNGQLPLLPRPGLEQLRPKREVRPIWTPIATFGKLVTVERSEIEAFRGTRNLIKTHVESASRDRKNTRPLSFAVFGPPGTGKSFTVQQIIDSISQTERSSISHMTINLSQLRNIHDLVSVLEEFRTRFPFTSVNNAQAAVEKDEPIPMIFFDEFDTDYEGITLGWLKFFLSIMQDGCLGATSHPIWFGPSILVFAGGTARRFNEFDPCNLADAIAKNIGPEILQSRIKEFREKKGPDFVSRLRSFVDIRGLDSLPGRTKMLIRRALVLRNILSGFGPYISEESAADMPNLNKVIRVHDDVLYALLTIDRYRHGFRSMEAIIKMCSPIDDTLMNASLPSRAQLDMHVNADEFFIRMCRGRARRERSKHMDRLNNDNIVPGR